MKNKLLIATLLIGCSAQSHAGFFDSFFGSDEKEVQSEELKNSAETVQMESNASADSQPIDKESMVTGLMPLLTQQLGVSDKQATGGMGSLMQLAQGALTKNEFGQLSEQVPGMDTLLAAAPALSGGGVGSMLSNAGGLASSLGGLGQVTKQFEALGLSSDMVLQFATLAVGYFSNSSNPGGGANTAGLLEKGLGAILGK